VQLRVIHGGSVPKQINTWTFGQALVNKFGLKGRFQPVLDETIVPVTIVDDQPGQRPATCGGSVTAVALANSYFRIENPTLTTLYRVRWSTWIFAAGARLAVDMAGAEPFSGVPDTKVAVTNERWSDTSIPGVPSALWFEGVTTTVMIASYRQLDSATGFLGLEWIVHPGDAINFYCTSADVGLNAWGAYWTEEPVTVTNR
jgi:hypothetical protein